MATSKITITLPDHQINEIRALVSANQAVNISAFIKHAVDVALSDAAGWKDTLETALQQTGGPLTSGERDWADSILAPHTGRPAAKRKRKVA